MMIARHIAWTFFVALAAFAYGSVSAQDYPNKVIHFIAPAAGSGSDVLARLIAQGLAQNAGWQVVVENRPSGVIPGETVAKAAPDGYTVLVSGQPLWLGPLLQPAPYNPATDFAPISLATTGPTVLVVHPSVPATSIKELIALAKAKPGELNYVGGATGGTTHLAGELFNSMAAVKIVRVPYKSGADETTDLLTGRVQMAFGQPPQVRPFVAQGKLRALAVTASKPSPLAPGLPTVTETLPGFVVESYAGALAPAKTPPAVINRLNQEINRVLSQPDVKQKNLDAGVDTLGSSPEQFAATIKSEMAKWDKVIKDAGIKGN